MKMKILDRIAVLLINVTIIIAAAVGPAMILASSPAYYKAQFEKNGIYAETKSDGTKEPHPVYFIEGDIGKYAYFTDEQLDFIAMHIINYLFGDGESFELVMNDVKMNGFLSDGVRVFGDEAVEHMEDVKPLMAFGKWASIISVILLPLLIFYAVYRRREIGRCALQYSLIFYGVLLLILGVILLISLINPGSNFLLTFWKNTHYLFFPFSPDKVAGSFFNDALTMILTLDLFMDAVITVLSILFSTLAAWIAYAAIVYRKYRKVETIQN